MLHSFIFSLMNLQTSLSFIGLEAQLVPKAVCRSFAIGNNNCCVQIQEFFLFLIDALLTPSVHIYIIIIFYVLYIIEK